MSDPDVVPQRIQEPKVLIITGGFISSHSAAGCLHTVMSVPLASPSPPTPVFEKDAMLVAEDQLSKDMADVRLGTSTPTTPSTPTASAPSYQSAFHGPPPVPFPYKPEKAIDDIPGVAYALELFLASHMHESEEFCDVNDKKKERMYFATGYGLIQCIKGLMSYEDEVRGRKYRVCTSANSPQDLLAGLTHTKRGIAIASSHRKKAPAVTTRLAGYIVPSLSTSSVAWVKSMTVVERHAELTYTETLYEKSLLGIVYSGDWLAFIREM